MIYAINVQKQRQEERYGRILSELEPETITKVEKYENQFFQDDEEDEYEDS